MLNSLLNSSGGPSHTLTPVYLQHVRHVLDRVEQECKEVVRCHVHDTVFHYQFVQELRDLPLYGDMN
jgi:hypothetical protein